MTRPVLLLACLFVAASAAAQSRRPDGQAPPLPANVAKDRDATRQIVALRAEISALERRLATPPRDAVRLRSDLAVKRLRLQVIAALARTEESPVGGRAPTADGRELCPQRSHQPLTSEAHADAVPEVRVAQLARFRTLRWRHRYSSRGRVNTSTTSITVG